MDLYLKHFLKGDFGRIPIFEPQGFDASNFVIEKDKGRFGRDTYYGSDEVSLRFSDDVGEPLEAPLMLDNGMYIYHYQSGLNYLLQEFKNKGNEAIIYYELEQGNEVVNIGQLFLVGTDRSNYVECKLIKVSEQANYERTKDTTVDLFSTTDIQQNTIEPIETIDILLDPKPVTQISKWGKAGSNLFINMPPNHIPIGVNYRYYNPCRNILEYRIEDTLTTLDLTYGFSGIKDKARFVRAKNDLSDLVITVKSNILYNHRFSDNPDPNNNPPTTSFGINVAKYNVNNNDITNITNVYFKTITASNSVNFKIPNDISLNIPFNLIAGEYLIIYFTGTSVQKTTDISNDLNITSHLVFNSCDISVKATSTAIPSVIKASRYINFIKKTFEHSGKLQIIAPRFDVGGEYYDQVCTTGNLIRQKTDKPFYVKLKDVQEQLFETACDYQINKENIFIGNYADFNPNIDLGGFLQAPNKDYKEDDNKDYLVNEFNYGYETFEDDRDEKNTIDAIHTKTEWSIPAINSQNKKDVKLPFFRDAFKFEAIRRRATDNTTTAEDSDDKIGILDIIQIAPNTRRKLIRTLNFDAVVGGQLNILSDSSFSWNLLGFKVGDAIFINNGVVTTTYIVTSFTNTILTLPYSGSVTESGSAQFTIDYPITGVLYKNRTNEGLFLAENLLNSDNYSNLRYSIKRNLTNWLPIIATYGKFVFDKVFKNTYFKSNGDCKTQFIGEANAITEKESINFNDIATLKIVNQNEINTTLIAPFDKVKKLLDDIQKIQGNSIGGFVRIQKTDGSIRKGYINKLDHIWIYNELTLTLEEKNESDFLEVTYNGTILTINEVGYTEKQVSQRIFDIFNDKIQFFDENNIILSNRTHYSNVRFNGVVYNTIDELASAIRSI